MQIGKRNKRRKQPAVYGSSVNRLKKTKRDVLAHIYNAKVGEYGKPFVACPKHFRETEQALSKNAPECFVEILAYKPVGSCNNCEHEND